MRIEAGEGRTRVFIREADCLASVTGPELADLERAFESCRALDRECEAADAGGG